MPSLHVPEEIAEPYVLKYGGFEDAKEEMKAVLEREAPRLEDA